MQVLYFNSHFHRFFLFFVFEIYNFDSAKDTSSIQSEDTAKEGDTNTTSPSKASKVHAAVLALNAVRARASLKCKLYWVHVIFCGTLL